MDNRSLAGVVGFFNSPGELIEGMKKVRDSQYQSYDAFTPYPVHGLDDAQGLKRSYLPYITFAFGLMGALGGFSLQYWTSVIDWPINVGGKPMNSWPAFVPVMFECTILLAGLSTVFGMFAINKLPNVTKKSFDPSITRDRFALMIDSPKSPDGKFKAFNENEAQDFLKQVGAQEVKKVYEEGWF